MRAMQEARDRQGGAAVRGMAMPTTPATPYNLFPSQHRRVGSDGASSAQRIELDNKPPRPKLPPINTTMTPHPSSAGTSSRWFGFGKSAAGGKSINSSSSSGGGGSRKRKGSSSGKLGSDNSGKGYRVAQVLMRALHVTCHMGLCVVVLYIMFLFLFMPTVTNPFRNQLLNDTLNERNNLNRKEAFGLVTVVTVDVLLDLYGLWVCRSEWSGVALAVRLVVGTGYIAMFSVYQGLGGRVFPLQFTFFGLKPAFATPFIYMFMWTLGSWDLLWVVMYRHRLRRGGGDDGAGQTELGTAAAESATRQGGPGHARKGSAWSNASSTWQLQQPDSQPQPELQPLPQPRIQPRMQPQRQTQSQLFRDEDELMNRNDSVLGRRESERQEREVLAPPGYLDSIRLSQWRKDRNDGAGSESGMRESLYFRTASRTYPPDWRRG